jgi:hypothetical protein
LSSKVRRGVSLFSILEYVLLFASKIKSDKRYRNAKIFFGGDFNLGDINWATGGTYLKVTS